MKSKNETDRVLREGNRVCSLSYWCPVKAQYGTYDRHIHLFQRNHSNCKLFFEFIDLFTFTFYYLFAQLNCGLKIILITSITVAIDFRSITNYNNFLSQIR